ncbi:MAG TPA: class I tRNA ligase family protein, partial [Jiangellaceae bacterium]
GSRGGSPGQFGLLELPTEIVSSEFLTMEGRKFSSSRGIVIYVNEFLSRYDADALRFWIAAAGPETQDTDFTWSEFVRRNNDELVAGWGNLVHRTVSMIARNVGSVPRAGELVDADHSLLATTQSAFDSVGRLLETNRQKQALQEAMRAVGAANTYLSQQEPWTLRVSDPERMLTVLHVAVQAVQDCNTLLTPFLPHTAERIHATLGGSGRWSDRPAVREVDDLDGGPGYPVIMLDDDRGSARWQSTPVVPGVPIPEPTPVFTKLDFSVVEQELARLEQRATG